MTIRTRFAPSPTGYLHIGGARTALFAWLFARHHGGDFILRIEDTDRERSTPESIEAIFQGMQWLGLDWDEAPVYQTKRFDHYKTIVDQLVSEDKAYRCYCSKDRLEQLRAQQKESGEKPRYDGLCRIKDEDDPDQPYVIRFKNPVDGSVAWDDLVRGKMEFQNSELDDLIIQRSDGTPTYNFTVVIDDADMKMTHVLRGDDHLNNTPRQINLFHALGLTPPVYAHLPMILGSDGKRLSKRHGAVSVMQYCEEGYLPEAMINYLARLGWSHGDQEIFSREELIEYFDTKHINRSPATFNPEKLQWLNQHYLRDSDPQDLIDYLCRAVSEKLGIPESSLENTDFQRLIGIQTERCHTLKEMVEQSLFCWQAPLAYDEEAMKQHVSPEKLSLLEDLCQALQDVTDWTEEGILAAIKSTLNKHAVKMGQLGPVIRIALTGNTQSPNLATTVYLVGQEESIIRLHLLQR